ncbi:hypothetical protein HY571_02985 [Candidatus Micrarchaeota archaeon]|nr:hypothetical protein [Candidatus Micrarchaeota archaeon]
MFKTLGGIIERHSIGRRPSRRFVKITGSVNLREPHRGFKLAAKQEKRPITTTVFVFPNEAQAQAALGEGFRYAGRGGLLPLIEIYAGTMKHNRNRVVVNVFNEALAEKWEKAINRGRKPVLLPRFRPREKLVRLKRD